MQVVEMLDAALRHARPSATALSAMLTHTRPNGTTSSRRSYASQVRTHKARRRLQHRLSLRIRLPRVMSAAFDWFALPTGMATTGVSESNLKIRMSLRKSPMDPTSDLTATPPRMCGWTLPFKPGPPPAALAPIRSPKSDVLPVQWELQLNQWETFQTQDQEKTMNDGEDHRLRTPRRSMCSCTRPI